MSGASTRSAQFVQQPALAEARFTDDQHELAAAAARLRELRFQRRELRVTARIGREALACRGFEARLQSRFAGQPIGRHRIRIGLQHHRLARAGIDERRHDALAFRAQQNRIARRDRSEPRRDLRGRTAHAVTTLAIVQSLRDQRAGMHAGSQRQRAAWQTRIDCEYARMQFQRGANGAQNVVLV